MPLFVYNISMSWLGILFALSITILFEPVFVAMHNKWSFKVYLTSLLSNIVLNTAMNVIWLWVLPGNGIFLACYEVFTVIVEFLLIHFLCKSSIKKSLPFVIVANIATLGVGLLFSTVIGIGELVMIIITATALLLTGCFLFLVLFNNIANKEYETNDYSTNKD